tara:strand:+ start:570 stop:1169 length:600 start_codon:yes stop_codon:yes gene_type:complete
MSREQLSTFTDGSFLALDPTESVLIHTDTTHSRKYIRLSGFNRGKRARSVSFSFNGVESIFASVQPTGSSQLLIPNLQLYNPGTGIDVTAALRQSPSAWTLPVDLPSVIAISNGSVTGLLLTSFAASVDAQPILLTVSDSRRMATDIDPTKGSEAIIEVYQNNGSIAVEVITAGYNLSNTDMDVTVSSGVYFFGDIFQD